MSNRSRTELNAGNTTKHDLAHSAANLMKVHGYRDTSIEKIVKAAYVSREVVEIGGESFGLRGHRVTLSEFNYELVRRCHTMTYDDDASTFRDVLARFGDDGTKELFRHLVEDALQDLIDAELTAKIDASGVSLK